MTVGHNRHRHRLPALPGSSRSPTTDEAKAAVEREDEEDIRQDLRERRRQMLKDEGWGGADPSRRDANIAAYLRTCDCGWDHPKGCDCGKKHPRSCRCNIPPWADIPTVFHQEVSPKEHGVTKTGDKKSGRKRKKQQKRVGPMPPIYRRTFSD